MIPICPRRRRITRLRDTAEGHVLRKLFEIRGGDFSAKFRFFRRRHFVRMKRVRPAAAG
jgi:hypothetical protein